MEVTGKLFLPTRFGFKSLLKWLQLKHCNFMPGMEKTVDTERVRVGVRVRPSGTGEAASVLSQAQDLMCNGKTYSYDFVLSPESSQSDVYAHVSPLVTRFLQGVNATVLAYGQTGAGKTYTLGTEPQASIGGDGVVPAALSQVFEAIGSNSAIVLKLSVIELRNDTVIDLLKSSDSTVASLTIRETKNGRVIVRGMRKLVVKSASHCKELLQRSLSARTVASTQMNSASSRSHCLITLHLYKCVNTQIEHSSAIAKEQQFLSKFHFVDLAGSERAKRTAATGERLKEAAAINSCLLALGNVINALARNSANYAHQTAQGKHSTASAALEHVPYRSSKLTRLLKDSLGGSAATLFLACISPSAADVDETTQTLQYAQRARCITNRINKPAAKRESLKSECIKLRNKVKALEAEVDRLKQAMSSKQTSSLSNDLFSAIAQFRTGPGLASLHTQINQCNDLGMLRKCLLHLLMSGAQQGQELGAEELVSKNIQSSLNESRDTKLNESAQQPTTSSRAPVIDLVEASEDEHSALIVPLQSTEFTAEGDSEGYASSNRSVTDFDTFTESDTDSDSDSDFVAEVVEAPAARTCVTTRSRARLSHESTGSVSSIHQTHTAMANDSFQDTALHAAHAQTVSIGNHTETQLPPSAAAECDNTNATDSDSSGHLFQPPVLSRALHEIASNAVQVPALTKKRKLQSQRMSLMFHM